MAGHSPPEGNKRLGTAMRRGAGSCPQLMTTGGSKASPGSLLPPLNDAAPAASDGTLAAALRAGPSAFASPAVEARSRKSSKAKKCMDSSMIGTQAMDSAAGSEERFAQMRVLLGQLNTTDAGIIQSGDDGEPANSTAQSLSRFAGARTVKALAPFLGCPPPKRENDVLGVSGPLLGQGAMTGSGSCPDLLGRRVWSPQRKYLRSGSGRQHRRAFGAGRCSSFFKHSGNAIAGGNDCHGVARPATGAVCLPTLKTSAREGSSLPAIPGTFPADDTTTQTSDCEMSMRDLNKELTAIYALASSSLIAAGF